MALSRVIRTPEIAFEFSFVTRSASTVSVLNALREIIFLKSFCRLGCSDGAGIYGGDVRNSVGGLRDEFGAKTIV